MSARSPSSPPGRRRRCRPPRVPVGYDLVYLIGRPEIKTREQLKGKSTAVTRSGSSIHFYLAFRAKVSRHGRRQGHDGSPTRRRARRSPQRWRPEESLRGSSDPLRVAVFAARLAGADRFIQNRSQVSSLLCRSSRSFVRKNPNTVERFLKAYTEAIHVIKTDHELWPNGSTQRNTASRIQRHRQDRERSIPDFFKSIPVGPTSGLETVIRELQRAKRYRAKPFVSPIFIKMMLHCRKSLRKAGSNS